jgi:thiamine monophosphate synthase
MLRPPSPPPYCALQATHCALQATALPQAPARTAAATPRCVHALHARAHAATLCMQVRRMLGMGAIVGVSVSTPAEAVCAAEAGADYVGAGAVFATLTKDTSVQLGVDGLRAIVQQSPVPVVAIGGINRSNAAETMAAGCAGVAVVSCLFDVDDVEAATRELRGVMGLDGTARAAATG